MVRLSVRPRQYSCQDLTLIFSFVVDERAPGSWLVSSVSTFAGQLLGGFVFGGGVGGWGVGGFWCSKSHAFLHSEIPSGRLCHPLCTPFALSSLRLSSPSPSEKDCSYFSCIFLIIPLLSSAVLPGDPEASLLVSPSALHPGRAWKTSQWRRSKQIPT